MNETQKPAPMASVKSRCEKLLLLPCIRSMFFTALVQLIFIAVLIVIVNFDIFHPFSWFGQLFGFHWLKHLPLLSVLVCNSFLMNQKLLAIKRYYPNRFKSLLGNAMSKLLLLAAQSLLGLLTAWSFMSYLRASDGVLFFEKDNISYLNSRFTFLSFVGIAAAVCHFVRYQLRQDVEITFDLLPRSALIKLRELLVNCAWGSILDGFTYTIGFTGLYWIFGGILDRRLAFTLGVHVDEQLHELVQLFTDLRLLCYAYLLVVEIFAIIQLMQHVLSVFLTTGHEFPIVSNPIDVDQVTLVAALSAIDVPIIQQLAALDFYNFSRVKSTVRRAQIFQLSQPGCHPYNWNQLSSQCLSIINAYTADLEAACRSLTNNMQTTAHLNITDGGLKPTPTELAQRVFVRQYNEMHNIRRLKTEKYPSDVTQTNVARINNNVEQVIRNFKERTGAILSSLPGLFYMFGEIEGARTAFLLANSDIIISIVQALASISTASLTEDSYGVLQLTLPRIMATFIRLKQLLDKLSSVSFNSKRLDPNLTPLRNALKRSFHKICNAFADYLPEIVADPNDLHYVRSFLYLPAGRHAGSW